MIRITGGTLKNRIIKSPKAAIVRPTMSKVRQQIFDALMARMSLENMAILDLFSGSGVLGFEALSRGARSAVFVDNHSRCLNTIEQSAYDLGISETCRVVCMKALLYVQKCRSFFDVIFADPPYQEPYLSRRLIEEIYANKELQKCAFLIFEHHVRDSFDGIEAFQFKIRSGSTSVSFFKSF